MTHDNNSPLDPYDTYFLETRVEHLDMPFREMFEDIREHYYSGFGLTARQTNLARKCWQRSKWKERGRTTAR